jgi:sortase A
MKDRRSVDDLSIEELEQILAIRKREAREARLRKMRAGGRTGRASVLEDMGTPITVGGGAIAKVKPTVAARTMNFLLLAVEVGAVIGLLYVLVNSAQLWQTLNREVQQVMAQQTPLPSPSPTAIIKTVVLPSGHTPPSAEGGAQFNLNEIPENLRPLVQAALPAVTIPTPSPMQAVRMVIPSLSVDARIVQGDVWEQLKLGIGQHIGSANPGQPGNLVAAAHNDIFGEIFRDLDQLQPGDEVHVYTQAEKFVYIITGTRIVAPTEVSVMDPTVGPTITLISCYPYMVNTERIVVFGELKN